MGWSCRREQGEALGRLHRAEQAQPGWAEGRVGNLLFEDTIEVRVFELCEDADGKHAMPRGSLRISPDGKFDLPKWIEDKWAGWNYRWEGQAKGKGGRSKMRKERAASKVGLSVRKGERS